MTTYKDCWLCGNKEIVGFRLMNGLQYKCAPLCLSCILHEIPFGVVVVFDSRAKEALEEETIRVSAEHPYNLAAGWLNGIAEKYKVLIISRLHDKADPCLYIKGPMLGVVFATDEIEDELCMMLEIEW